MAKYKRYQKLQKYYLGVPVEPAEYKEGELIDIKDYNNIEECEKDTPQITYNNWVATSSDIIRYNNGFTINSLGTGDDGLYHFTIEGAGTNIQFNTFSGSVVYSHFIDLSNFTNLESMFQENIDYIGGNFTGWNTSNVTIMIAMFYNCYKLTTLDLSSFDTRNVTHMNSMFNQCRNLKNLNISSFNTSNVTTMYSMFNACESLTTLDLSSFNTSKVVDMSNMFNDCYKLTTLDLSSFNTSNVTEVINMFNDCKSLTTLNIIGWDLTNAYNNNHAYQMFKNCTSLQKIYAHGCNEATINCINENLSNAGLTDKVTIIT